jgi:hypothetical protein
LISVAITRRPLHKHAHALVAHRSTAIFGPPTTHTHCPEGTFLVRQKKKKNNVCPHTRTRTHTLGLYAPNNAQFGMGEPPLHVSKGNILVAWLFSATSRVLKLVHKCSWPPHPYLASLNSQSVQDTHPKPTSPPPSFLLSAHCVVLDVFILKGGLGLVPPFSYHYPSLRLLLPRPPCASTWC